MSENPAGAIRLFRSRLFIIPAAIYLALGIVLAFLPLTNYLGLEFSLAVCVATGLIGGPLAVGVFHRRVPAGADRATAATEIGAVNLWVDAILIHGAAVLFSLVGLVVSVLVHRPCAPLRGAGFFLLLPLVGVAYSTAWGLAFASLVKRARRAKVLVVAFALLTLACSTWKFAEGPAVWIYNSFFGFFPGPIYDAAVTPSDALIAYRLQNLALAWLVVYALAAVWGRQLRRAGHRARPRVGTLVMAVTLLATLVGLHEARFSLGFDMDRAHLRQRLDGRLRTEHFDIYYPRRADVERNIRLIAADHEFFFAQVERQLGIRYPHRITSWIYPSEASKKKWIGASGTELARCGQHEMHLNYEPFPIDILHHELAHVMLSDYGLPLIGISSRAALLEGMAVAFGGSLQMDQDIDRWAAGMKAIDRLPRIKHIMGLRFWSESGARAYVAAGSFVRFLSRRPDGVKKLLAAYEWGTLGKHFDRPLAGLEKEWLAHLTTLEAALSEAEIARAQHRFGAKSIFEIRCPREVARLLDEADRQASRSYFYRADLLYREAAELDRDDTRLPRLRLTPLLRTRQFALADRLAHDISAAQGTPEHPATDRKGKVVGSQIVAQQADLIAAALAWSQGDLEHAKPLYEKVLGASLTSSLVREAACAQYAFYHAETEPVIREYLTDFGNARSSRWLLADALPLHPDDAVVWYLVSRRMLGDGAYPQAINALQRALALGLPHPALVQEAWSALGQTRFMIGDLAGARAAFLELRSLQGASDAVATTDEWLARIAVWIDLLKTVQPAASS